MAKSKPTPARVPLTVHPTAAGVGGGVAHFAGQSAAMAHANTMKQTLAQSLDQHQSVAVQHLYMPAITPKA